MEPVFQPQLTLSLAVNVTFQYNSFNGKTDKEAAETFVENMRELLWDEVPHLVDLSIVNTKLTNS
jgi:hypothetical protein